MSYCRTSAPDSDVYIYGTKTHIFVHVAHNLGPANTVPTPGAGAGSGAWEKFMNDVIPFDNPHAGETLMFKTYSECMAKLRELEADGVRVPSYVYDRMRTEQVTSDNYAQAFEETLP